MNTQTASTSPTLLTPTDAARRVGISSRSLYRFILSGELRSVKIGRRRLVDPADLAAFIEAHKTGRP